MLQRIACQRIQNAVHPVYRGLSTSQAMKEKYKCDLLIVGGGSGGCTMAAKFASKLGKNRVIIVEPKDIHYYQPMFTLVGGGMKSLSNCGRPMSSVLPSAAKWVKDEVVKFDPKGNMIITTQGHEIEYNFMIVAVGLTLDFNKVKGLEAALNSDFRVCSNYSPKYVEKTYQALQNFKSGNVLFTFPNTPIKCAGAPQKIMYIADQYLRKVSKREKANIKYFTSLGVLFGVKKYADALWVLCKRRGLEVNLRHNLVEVRHEESKAVFENLDKPGETVTLEYALLHATPPMSTPLALSTCSTLVDTAGYLEVDKYSLRHIRFPNVFGIGDCTSAPTSKTAAAVAAQSGVLRKHLSAAIAGKDSPSDAYDGYTSCPLVTGSNSCILAEFDYNAQPLETFPINQAKERHSMFFLKKFVMPQLYWHAMLTGYWEGPKIYRKIMHFGLSK